MQPVTCRDGSQHPAKVVSWLERTPVGMNEKLDGSATRFDHPTSWHAQHIRLAAAIMTAFSKQKHGRRSDLGRLLVVFKNFLVVFILNYGSTFTRLPHRLLFAARRLLFEHADHIINGMTLTIANHVIALSGLHVPRFRFGDRLAFFGTAFGAVIAKQVTVSVEFAPRTLLFFAALV